MAFLRVSAIRDDGSYWSVDVRTLRHALKVARKLRWQAGWPTWIYCLDQPADLHLIGAWRKWEERRRVRDAWQQPTTGGVH